MTGTERIAAERKRQIEREGWTPEHDACYVSGELSIAAACYAVNKLPEGDLIHIRNVDMMDDGFPWEPKFDKREQHSRLRSLEIAGALIAAEIDRMTAAGAVA
jgi:hypothetical protein